MGAVNASRVMAKVNAHAPLATAQAKRSVSIVQVKVVSDAFRVTVRDDPAGTTPSARIVLVTDTNSAANAMEGALMIVSCATDKVMMSATTVAERASLTVKRVMATARWM